MRGHFPLPFRGGMSKIGPFYDGSIFDMGGVLPNGLDAREEAPEAASSRFIRHPPPSPSLEREGR